MSHVQFYFCILFAHFKKNIGIYLLHNVNLTLKLLFKRHAFWLLSNFLFICSSFSFNLYVSVFVFFFIFIDFNFLPKLFVFSMHYIRSNGIWRIYIVIYLILLVLLAFRKVCQNFNCDIKQRKRKEVQTRENITVEQIVSVCIYIFNSVESYLINSYNNQIPKLKANSVFIKEQTYNQQRLLCYFFFFFAFTCCICATTKK